MTGLAAIFIALGLAAAPAAPIPIPPPPMEPVVFVADSPTYRCGEGEPASTPAELYDFNERYGAHAASKKGYRGGDAVDAEIGTIFADMPVELDATEGLVTMNVAVAADGTVIDMVVECATHPSLPGPARYAARAAKYKASTLDGVPVADTIGLTVRFRRR